MKAFFTLLLFFFISANIIGQTTQEEYNFITKGYRFTIDYGLDMKENYTMKFIKKYTFSTTYTANIQGLFRNDDHLAGYLVSIKDGTLEKDICIPTEQSSDEIWKQYDYLLQSLPLSTQRYFTITLSRFLSQKPTINTATITPLPDSTKFSASTPPDSEEGTGGVVIPKATNPLLPSNVKGINHHTIRFFPNPPQTGKEVNGNIKLNFCVSKKGEVTEASVLQNESSINDEDVINLVLANVRKYKFSLNVYAPDIECGSIIYTFTKTETTDE